MKCKRRRSLEVGFALRRLSTCLSHSDAMAAQRDVLMIEAPPDNSREGWCVERYNAVIDALPIDDDYGDPRVKDEVDRLVEEELRRSVKKLADFLKDLPPLPNFGFEIPSRVSHCGPNSMEFFKGRRWFRSESPSRALPPLANLIFRRRGCCRRRAAEYDMIASMSGGVPLPPLMEGPDGREGERGAAAGGVELEEREGWRRRWGV